MRPVANFSCLTLQRHRKHLRSSETRCRLNVILKVFVLLMLPAIFGALVGETAFALQKAQKTIFLAPDDHTDYFWTADDVQCRAAFIKTLEFYLGQIEQTQNERAEFQAR